MDAYENRTWTWTDGTPVDYIGWANGRPNRAQLSSFIGEPDDVEVQCVLANAIDRWLEVPCEQTLDGFICKKKAPSLGKGRSICYNFSMGCQKNSSLPTNETKPTTAVYPIGSHFKRTAIRLCTQSSS